MIAVNILGGLMLLLGIILVVGFMKWLCKKDLEPCPIDSECRLNEGNGCNDYRICLEELNHG